ncbi:MAG: trypsin-like peptidase domain-containing protein [Gemmataceae bacterium]|nr:trypsin-like peptidase domain-containing protein [Gemmataceae bacterium]
MKSLFAVLFVAVAAVPATAQNPPGVLKSESDRVAVIERIKPAVVAIFARGGGGGGTGVVISDDGYALTNFHVVNPTGPTPQCGLPDGILYDAVVVGIDKVGDVALIKLLPPKAGRKFPYVVLGDSDLVREGDWSIAMGNPFLLATDFTPTVTFGLVSGVHRYQYPAGLFLEYTDCIQIDTSINPGNSGGPLFNMKGELIGINGRGSFDKRGRVNSGVGYAISINQIKNFLGHLRAGLAADHASLGALVTTQTDAGGLGRMAITQILEESDVARRGLDYDDELISFAGRPISSVNHYRNVLGIYPRGWRVPLEYRRERTKKEVLVRLMGMQKKEFPGMQIDDSLPKPEPQPRPMPGDKPRLPLPGKGKGKAPGPKGPGAKLFEAKEGFANYYFNRLERDRLLAAFAKHGDFSGMAGDWSIDGFVRLKKLRTESKTRIDILEVKDGKSSRSLVKLNIDQFPYELEPFKQNQDPVALKMPETSGGLLSAMYLYHRLLTQGVKGFTEINHGGHEPFYPPPTDGKTPARVAARRVDAEVLNTRHGPFLTKWFFALTDQKLLGFEVRLQDNEDPCEVYLADYRPVEGRLLPRRMQVMYGDGHYGTFSLERFNLAK